MLSSRFAGIPISSSTIDGPGLPQLLIRGERAPSAVPAQVAGFISEWWPASNRNGGRLQIGIGGRIASEFARNAHVADEGRGLWLVTQTFVCVTVAACHLWFLHAVGWRWGQGLCLTLRRGLRPYIGPRRGWRVTEVRRVLQLLLRHIEYCHIRITLARLRSGRIGFDGRRGGCAAGGGRRCHRRGLGNHSSQCILLNGTATAFSPMPRKPPTPITTV